jgi:hypothetical protein
MGDPIMTTAGLTAAAPNVVRPTRWLRALLLVNGIANVVGGVPLLFLAGVLASPTGLPSHVLVEVGVFYLAYGAAMWFAGSRPRPRSAAVAGLIAVNPSWALGCLLILMTNSSNLTTLGAEALGGEAAFVTALAAVEWVAYRRSQKSGIGVNASTSRT